MILYCEHGLVSEDLATPAQRGKLIPVPAAKLKKL